jgi:large subunit ribosomal protein L18
MNRKESRVRRSRQTRIKIAELKAHRLSIYRSNSHISAQLYSPCGTKVLASASTMEEDLRKALSNNGGNSAAAQQIGKVIAERAIKAGVTEVAFDRSGFRYHGRVKALAEAAREAGLKF